MGYRQNPLSKGFMGLMGKTPVLAGVFFDSYSIVVDWRKLLRNGDVVCFVLVMGSWGLTCDFAGKF